MRLRGSCESALVLYAKSVMKIWPQRRNEAFTRILVLLARAVLEGTHLFQTGTHTDVVRMLRD